MKPPFAYYGGKVGLAQRIVDLMPHHRVYIEPFFGSGAVFFRKVAATHEIINDLDGAVVAFFKCLRERREELDRVCRLTPYARAEFEAADLDAPCDELELARRFWVRVNQSFAKTAGRRTGWSVTSARTQSPPASVASRLGRFAACAERLMGASIERCDGVELVTRLGFRRDAVIYVDPPYPGVSRVERKSNYTGDYRLDMLNTESHEALAFVLKETPATVFLSGYHSPLYEDLYGGWHRVEWDVTAHSSNATTVERGKRVEVLWSNKPIETGMFAEAKL